MSDEQKAIEMPSKNNDKKVKAAKKTNKKSIGWILGVVILILISVTFIIPATAFSGNHSSTGLKFGAYKGKNVELNYNSYFYYQLQNVYNY
ncbi:MAG: peptidylprolyl isomerase, partial [Spirochaetales bacterium]|nr:peptidylprolyl isomerase [Candidatus Physcosoma equi]